MVLDKPQDLAVMLAIASLIMVTAGIGIASVNNEGAGINATFFNDFNNNVTSATGFQGVAADSIGALSGVNGSSGEFKEANLITQGFTGIVNLGKAWG